MTTLGQICLLVALVGSGFGAFACMVGWSSSHRVLAKSGVVAATAGVAALSMVAAVLAWALVARDFSFTYVAQYSSRELPWQFALSAFWVGQAGSLLLWAWLLGILALVYRFWPRRATDPLVGPAFAVLVACLAFLVAVMVFGADPMEPSLSPPAEGNGLGPALQHPAMLIHPPLVLLSYAGWSVPFALAMAALLTGRLDSGWIRQSRPWALFSWVSLGAGILLGAEWAYEELGWGGYWSWDPVENGSLIPWLTGTALIHTLMAWQYRGVLKKTAILLAVATLALCNFAAFLTRSGIFSSLHAFSQSPIGWMFLALLTGLVAGGVLLVAWRRKSLAPDRPIAGIWTRESLVTISTVSLLLLAAVTLLGTLMIPLSKFVVGRDITVGPAFYNNVLVPLGTMLLAATALAPLTKWVAAPSDAQKRMFFGASGLAILATVVEFALGNRHWFVMLITLLAVFATVAVAGSVVLDARRRASGQGSWGPGFSRSEKEKPPEGGTPTGQKKSQSSAALVRALQSNRRQYAGFLIHLGFACLAVGVTGSALGKRECELDMKNGQTIPWAGKLVHFAGLAKCDRPDAIVVQARLDVSRNGGSPVTLLPSQNWQRLQRQWFSRVDINSAWSGDIYAILHGGEGEETIHLTLIDSPRIRWMWLSGYVMAIGAVIGLGSRR